MRALARVPNGWASRQAARIAKASGKTELPIDDIRDFVDRIEVLYAWSQFRLDPHAELPGRQVLASLIDKDSYVFGGANWKKRREQRRFSTAFTAAITYGPALKALGWVYPDARHSVVLHPSPRVDAALDAFEAGIAEHLAHPAFSQFGEVEVMAEEVAAWGADWSLNAVTPEEQRVFVETRARQEAEAWAATTSTEFLRHMVESWVLAQHVYWSIGRGLNDARAGGKTLLRLRVVMDEGGWRLAPGAFLGNPPLPTPDRLASALSLARECSLLDDLND